jgi:hypothetical protein
MWHATYTQGNWGDYWFLVVGSQIANLTLGPSFGHNLCFKCPNGWCESILNIHVLRSFQWYKKHFNPMNFDSCNCLLKIWESIETPTSQSGGSFGSVGVHSLSLSYTPGSMKCDSRAHSWPALSQALALVVNPRLGLWQKTWPFI